MGDQSSPSLPPWRSVEKTSEGGTSPEVKPEVKVESSSPPPSFYSNNRKYIMLALGIFLFFVFRQYPGVGLQFLVGLVAYEIVKRYVVRRHSPDEQSDNPRAKRAFILSLLGLLGLLSPVVGFVFIVPALVISRHLLTPSFSKRKKLMIFSGIVLVLIIVNAALGTILYTEGLL